MPIGEGVRSLNWGITMSMPKISAALKYVKNIFFPVMIRARNGITFFK
jgi:hypothetical protein